MKNKTSLSTEGKLKTSIVLPNLKTNVDFCYATPFSYHHKTYLSEKYCNAVEMIAY